MPSTRELRRRIRSARLTKQITRAQEMIAAAKLRQSTQAALSSRNYALEIERLLANLLVTREDPPSHPWLHLDSSLPVLVVAISSNQGLAGPFQGNLLRTAIQLHSKFQASKRKVIFLAIGSRLQNSLKRLEYPLLRFDSPTPRQPGISDAEHLANVISMNLAEHKIGEIHLVSTFYRSSLTQEVTTRQLLPYLANQAGERHSPLYEPSTNEVLNELFPQYLVGTVYNAYLESKASELAARRTAMHAATDNAEDLISHLTLTYNRVRQAAITTEIAEIVGGAAALSN